MTWGNNVFRKRNTPVRPEAPTPERDIYTRQEFVPELLTGQHSPEVTAAAIEMLSRTGAVSFALRVEDSEEPPVWIATASWIGRETGKVVWEIGSHVRADQAILRLLNESIDGSRCRHCGRRTGVMDDWTMSAMAETGIPGTCWYIYDPELKKFRRGCESE